MVIPILWLAQVVTFAAGIYGPWRDAAEIHAGGRVARPIRMGIAASLVFGAWWNWAHAGSEINQVYTTWILAGMAASFVGDLVMARLIPLPNRLIGGMVAFGIGHALYIKGYAATVTAAGGEVVGLGLGVGLTLYTLANLAGWATVVRNPAKPAALNIGALVYGAWIGVMAAFALGLATTLGGAYWMAAVGGVIFIVSDLIIGITEIGGIEIRNANDWVWLTYIAGQMGIVYAGWMAA